MKLLLWTVAVLANLPAFQASEPPQLCSGLEVTLRVTPATFPRGAQPTFSVVLRNASAQSARSPFTVSTNANRPAKDEALLRELQQVLAKAWVTGDRATIERIIAPEWRATGPDGSVTDRAAVLASVFETGVHKIQRVDITEVLIRVYGDAAVVTGRTHGMGAYSGTPYDVVIRFTDTFVRRNGQWQAVASHSSLQTR